ncbi:MAG: ABC transporter ATP-binding protein/permease [Candidatus Protistobacter heckmanni]|nr:ABC transporter ATP-binding protein/permease [Candidatus Protistobacter heckmanni]
MRRYASSESPPNAAPSPAPAAKRNDWRVIARLLPYLRNFKFRILLALSCLIGAKIANLGVPMLLKHLIDAMNVPKGSAAALVVVPVGIIVGYGLLRLSASLFTELRELLFSKVTENAVRNIALSVFRHLHALSLRFHLARQTGGMSRDIERGTRGIQSLISYSLYSILPTLVEFGLVLGYLGLHYDGWFAGIALAALVLYIAFTVGVTEWRTHLRRRMNDADSRANQRAVDSLLNFETVKYFGNEEYEARRYDENLQLYRKAAIRSQTSLSILNFGQQTIIAAGLIGILYRATVAVSAGSMTLGDLVLVNTLMIQLYIPLNFLGVIYREIKQSVIDMDRMFNLLETEREVADKPGAPALIVRDAQRGPLVRFEHVNFGYEKNRQILFDVDFAIEPGTTTAVVGHSGSGKSTLARLLFRFYDVNAGAILIDGQDLREVSQQSLRKAIGIVPQDTVLFNDTIYYNIAYGNPEADHDAVIAAARAAHIHGFIETLPEGYDTPVGERGLKLSGGEKQRVAIARTLLKNPQLLVFDEATSALDSRTEQAIQAELLRLASSHTTLVIAHRLSTIVNAHQILVMENGRIVERGNHASLLRAGGNYEKLWEMQQRTAGAE